VKETVKEHEILAARLPMPPQAFEVVAGSDIKPKEEAMKEAEKAILNLYSQNIRFPTFMEEGFAPDIVQQLFDKIGLGREASKAINATNVSGLSEKEANAASPTLHVKALPPTIAVGKPNEVLLTSITSPVTPSDIASKAAAAADKERTLQLKMEALRKSREERAKTAAAAKIIPKAAVAPATSPDAMPAPAVKVDPSKPASNPPAELLAPLTSRAEEPMPAPVPPTNPSNSIQSLPLPQVLSQEVPSATPTTQSSASPAIPGLFLGSPVQRKRPVAADFDTVVAPTPFKRPFGQSRGGDTPLVIDVSEVSGLHLASVQANIPRGNTICCSCTLSM
jgi:hypothetical protein